MERRFLGEDVTLPRHASSCLSGRLHLLRHCSGTNQTARVVGQNKGVNILGSRCNRCQKVGRTVGRRSPGQKC